MRYSKNLNKQKLIYSGVIYLHRIKKKGIRMKIIVILIFNYTRLHKKLNNFAAAAEIKNAFSRYIIIKAQNCPFIINFAATRKCVLKISSL